MVIMRCHLWQLLGGEAIFCILSRRWPVWEVGTSTFAAPKGARCTEGTGGFQPCFDHTDLNGNPDVLIY